jgi:1-pyrroline-5-carboxylate dehydrogenase
MTDAASESGANGGFRVTYATMSANSDALHAAYDVGIRDAEKRLGADHPFYVSGEARLGDGWVVETSPIDREIVVARFAQAGAEDVGDAVDAARAFAPRWAATPWQDRVALLLRGADLISERRDVLAALMAFEVGKNRLEALGDVEESADLIRYYCHEMERNEGFDIPMKRLSPNEATRDVMRPYGVWGVISPFNFPMALAAGPAGAALAAGNTVVLKPSNTGALSGLEFWRTMIEAGIPAEAFHVVTGAGPVAGAALATMVDGITFTGSYEVGMGIHRDFSTVYPKPAICEMGGKNPVIVSRQADLDLAANGIMRSAFGFGGQKCSAASRVYVEGPAHDELVERLVAATSEIVIGNPLDRDVYLGPVIDDKAVARYQAAVAEVTSSGGTVVTGGERLDEGELARGTFLAPTVVEAPERSWVWRRELFAPFVAVARVDSIADGISRANDTEYGLTAGFFSNDSGEVDQFLSGIEAGVVYINRRAGATTGAWPAVQPFGGWKGSGTGGKAGGGPYYVAQYLREQSRTIVEA